MRTKTRDRVEIAGVIMAALERFGPLGRHRLLYLTRAPTNYYASILEGLIEIGVIEKVSLEKPAYMERGGIFQLTDQGRRTLKTMRSIFELTGKSLDAPFAAMVDTAGWNR